MAPRRLSAVLLLVVVCTACSTSRGVRLDTGQGPPLEHRPPTSYKPLRVEPEAFEEAVTQLMLEVRLTLRPPQQGVWVQASYPGRNEDARWQGLMGKSFGGLCEAGQRQESCLSLLDDVMGLSEWDKLGVALGLSIDPLKESTSLRKANCWSYHTPGVAQRSCTPSPVADAPCSPLVKRRSLFRDLRASAFRSRRTVATI